MKNKKYIVLHFSKKICIDISQLLFSNQFRQSQYVSHVIKFTILVSLIRTSVIYFPFLFNLKVKYVYVFIFQYSNAFFP